MLHPIGRFRQAPGERRLRPERVPGGVDVECRAESVAAQHRPRAADEARRVRAGVGDHTSSGTAATVAAIAANVLLQAIGALAWGWSGMQRAPTAGFLTGNRNIGLVLVALGSDASFEVIAFFAAAQIPMYMLPGLPLPLYRPLLVGA
jgi:hypothetical protein